MPVGLSAEALAKEDETLRFRDRGGSFAGLCC
ncbi:MAG: hypothetical protein ACI9TB_002820, partial [Parasphingorhabdus sp.]